MKNILFTGFFYLIAATLSATYVSSASQLLFAEITSFTATYDSDTGTISVDWSVWNENNVKTYELKKAFEDTDEFSVIQNMKSTGNKTESTSYHFIDSVEKPGIYYYRLNTWYNDNSIEFSKIISVKIVPKLSAADVNIYPNPANDMIFLDISNSNQSDPKITIFDLLGKEITVDKDMEDIGNQIIISIPSNAIEAGTYIVRIEMNGLSYLDKVSIIK